MLEQEFCGAAKEGGCIYSAGIVMPISPTVGKNDKTELGGGRVSSRTYPSAKERGQRILGEGDSSEEWKVLCGIGNPSFPFVHSSFSFFPSCHGNAGLGGRRLDTRCKNREVPHFDSAQFIRRGVKKSARPGCTPL